MVWLFSLLLPHVCGSGSGVEGYSQYFGVSIQWKRVAIQWDNRVVVRLLVLWGEKGHCRFSGGYDEVPPLCPASDVLRMLCQVGSCLVYYGV